MPAVRSLAEIRAEIDGIDAEILQLINRRARCAEEVAKTKMADGEQNTFYRPDREAMVLRRIQTLNNGPLPDDSAMRIFRELMSACLALEKPLEIAYLGPEGTFSQQAVFKHFGTSVQTLPVSTIGDVFNAVELNKCHFGVVPVENSTEGVISHTLDRFLNSPLKICGEVELRVHQNLLGLAESLGDIREIYSHQQSLAQCRNWLERHLPAAKLTPVTSNAEAARLASQDKHSAAIASIAAAEVYHLPILEVNIEDEINNTTRFIVIGQQDVSPTGKDKTSLVFSTGNQPGTLYRSLEAFANFGIGMANIESRPSRQGLWDYVFFIDIDGHCCDVCVAEALAILKNNVSMLKLLGSYPKAIL